MTLFVEKPKLVVSQAERKYYCFSLRILEGEFSLSVSGWRYYPDNRTISTPSQYKGQGKYVNTVNLTAETYNIVQDVAIKMFGGSDVSEHDNKEN